MKFESILVFGALLLLAACGSTFRALEESAVVPDRTKVELLSDGALAIEGASVAVSPLTFIVDE